jgi:hypothetical protein
MLEVIDKGSSSEAHPIPLLSGVGDPGSRRGCDSGDDPPACLRTCCRTAKVHEPPAARNHRYRDRVRRVSGEFCVHTV